MTAYLREHYLREHLPAVPILIVGSGDRLAALQADIIGMTGAATAHRAGRVCSDAAGDRFDQLELNMVLTAVSHDGAGIRDLSLTHRYVPTLSDAQLLKLPTVLTDSPRDMADTLRRYREAYGPRYLSVQRQHAESFSKVIAELR